MEHVSIVLKIIALMAGISVIFYIYQSYKKHTSSTLKYYFYFCVFLNLVLLIATTSKYSSVNILDNHLVYKSTTLAHIITPLTSYFFIIMIYFLVLVFISLFEITLSRNFKTIIYLGFTVITLSYVIRIILELSNKYWNILPKLHSTLIETGFIVLFLFLICFLIMGFKVKGWHKKRLILFLGIFYIIAFSILLYAIFLPYSSQIIINPVVMLVFNIAPYFGVKYFFLPLYRNSLTEKQGSLILDSLCRKYKISKREREIAELILLGKSNKEIQDKLYISLNTVKNHIYNLYQKTGIKSRGQLVHFILEFEK